MAPPRAKQHGWHREDIKAAIRKRGTTVTQLALDNGLSDSACRVALVRPSPAGESVISSFLGVPLQVLWPDRYDPYGRRLATRHVRDQNSRNRSETHRQFAGAR
ncbi:helix-turn-helix domain-containing protein [Phenylobacterium sp.]|uniref:helix-turn-helix domain-containing protein n=1 Tax=Phenylobacterium sp. TaxID=1871053 RepID=UPI0035219BBC